MVFEPTKSKPTVRGSRPPPCPHASLVCSTLSRANNFFSVIEPLPHFWVFLLYLRVLLVIMPKRENSVPSSTLDMARLPGPVPWVTKDPPSLCTSTGVPAGVFQESVVVPTPESSQTGMGLGEAENNSVFAYELKWLRFVIKAISRGGLPIAMVATKAIPAPASDRTEGMR